VPDQKGGIGMKCPINGLEDCPADCAFIINEECALARYLYVKADEAEERVKAIKKGEESLVNALARYLYVKADEAEESLVK
jgi:hypothetical protein